MLLHPALIDYGVLSGRIENIQFTTGTSYNFYIPEDILTYSRIHKKFKALKESWLEQTAYLSDPAIRFNNPFYNQIIEMGVSITPILFEELFSYKMDWFDALSKIYNVNPISPENKSNYDQMILAWKNWRIVTLSAA